MKRIDTKDKPLTPYDVKKILSDFCISLTPDEAIKMEFMSEPELERFQRDKIKERLNR